MPSRSLCTIPNCDDHYSCRLRNKGLQISPRAQTTRSLNWRPTPSIPPKSNGAIVYEDRPGGHKIPVLKEDGNVLYKRDYRENSQHIDNTIRNLRNSGNTTKD